MNVPGRLSAVSIVLMCSALLSAQTPALKPYVYTSDGMMFSAPIEPVLEKTPQNTDLGPVEMHGYMVDLGNDFAFVVYAADFHGAKGLSLQGGRDGFLTSLKARATSEKTISLAGSPGIEFEYESTVFHGRAQMFVVGSVLYQVLAIAPLSKPLPAVFETMFRSFRILQGAA